MPVSTKGYVVLADKWTFCLSSRVAPNAKRKHKRIRYTTYKRDVPRENKQNQTRTIILNIYYLKTLGDHTAQ